MMWWRAHHGITNDPKLAVVAAKASARRCEVGWVWIILLDYASQSPKRGSIKGLDPDVIAHLAEIDRSTVDHIMTALIERELVQLDGTLTAWDKRQYDDYSTDRVRRYRDRLKHEEAPDNAPKRPVKVETNVKRDETERNARKPPDNRLQITDTDTEQKSYVKDQTAAATAKGANAKKRQQQQPKFPLTVKALANYDLGVNGAFFEKLKSSIFARTRAEHIPDDLVKDQAIADAIHESYRTYRGGKKEHGVGLLLSRVPEIICKWGKAS